MKNNNNILILVPDLDLPGGVTNYYNTLKLDKAENISYFLVNVARPQSIFGTFLRLASNYFKFIYTVLAGRYKIVHVNPSLDYKSFHRDLMFIIISNILNRKVIVTFHGWLDHYEEKIKKSKFKSLLFRISYAKTKTYLVLGEIFKKKLIGLGVPSETKFYIETMVADPSGIQELDLEKKFKAYEKEIIFLFLSRIEKEKGIYIAIDAFNHFVNQFPNRISSLVIAGDGSELAAAKAYVKEKRIPNIIFLGYVDGDYKMKVLLESHIMIFPSFTEGLPNVILEGMLYGMPIISRITGGLSEVIQCGINGYLSESYDAEIFANFISRLAYDNELYKNISKNNNQLALQKFTSEKVRERILNIYKTFY